MKLKIAIQKSGRLHEDSVKLLKECGIGISNGMNSLRVSASNFPIELLYLRDDDIPQYVEDGVADVGIIGENVLIEKNRKVQSELPLGFAKCRLSIATPKGEKYTGAKSLSGKKIATSYPGILSAYLRKFSIQAEIHEISGSVEIAPNVGLADAICDLVSSGSTLFLNSLEEQETILYSQAVLIKNTRLARQKQEILDQLSFRINSVLKAKSYKYILLNAPNNKLETIISVLPGLKSPTIYPLAIQDWSSIHTVIREDDFWNVTEQLTKLGASGILVTSIEKMIP